GKARPRPCRGTALQRVLQASRRIRAPPLDTIRAGGRGSRRAADGRSLPHEATRVRGRAEARPSSASCRRADASETRRLIRYALAGAAPPPPAADGPLRKRARASPAAPRLSP